MDIGEEKQSHDEHESAKDENIGVAAVFDTKPRTCNFL